MINAVRVTVVMPLYNKRDFVLPALASALVQDPAPSEIIVVDDGSTDGGGALVLDYATRLKLSNVLVVTQDNAGVSAARNRGIQEAHGELVAFLDADDSWAPGFLSAAVAALADNPQCGAAFGSIIEQSALRERPLSPDFSHEVVIDDYPGWFMRHRGHGLWSSDTVAWRKRLIACGGFPVGVQNGEDTDTWFRLSFEAPVVFVPGARAFYRIADEASLSHRFRAVEPLVLQTLAARMAAGTIPEPARRSARSASHYFRAAYAIALALDGRRAEAWRQLSIARPGLAYARTYVRAVVALVLGR